MAVFRLRTRTSLACTRIPRRYTPCTPKRPHLPRQAWTLVYRRPPGGSGGMSLRWGLSNVGGPVGGTVGGVMSGHPLACRWIGHGQSLLIQFGTAMPSTLCVVSPLMPPTERCPASTPAPRLTWPSQPPSTRWWRPRPARTPSLRRRRRRARTTAMKMGLECLPGWGNGTAPISDAVGRCLHIGGGARFACAQPVCVSGVKQPADPPPVHPRS